MKTRLLLDTCAIFYVTEQKLGAKALEALDEAFDDSIPVRVSPITAWEIGMLSARGRLPTTARATPVFGGYYRGNSGSSVVERPGGSAPGR